MIFCYKKNIKALAIKTLLVLFEIKIMVLKEFCQFLCAANLKFIIHSQDNFKEYGLNPLETFHRYFFHPLISKDALLK